MGMPKSLCAFGGIDAVTHAMEAYVSVLANESPTVRRCRALKLLKDYLPPGYHDGADDPEFREKVRNTAAITRYRVCQRLPGCVPLHGPQTRVRSSTSPRSGQRPA
ncbi:iron-containing alcohol dehydrogenase [Shigella flexneri]